MLKEINPLLTKIADELCQMDKTDFFRLLDQHKKEDIAVALNELKDFGEYMTEQQIAESKAKSEAKYRKRQEAAKARKELIKRGNQYILENNIEVYKVVIDNEEIAIGIHRKNFLAHVVLAHVGLAYCSYKDTWSNKIAKGLVGIRLQDKDPERTLFLNGLQQVSSLVIIYRAIDIILEHCYYNGFQIPGRLRRKAIALEKTIQNKNQKLFTTLEITRIN